MVTLMISPWNLIKRPDRPLTWINSPGSRHFFGLISKTARGHSFFKEAHMRRLVRYRYNNTPLDSNGGYIYWHHDGFSSDPSETLFWSPSWQPKRIPLDNFERRHSMGYTIIESVLAGIEARRDFRGSRYEIAVI
jgi:cellobiose phosphorylase